MKVGLTIICLVWLMCQSAVADMYRYKDTSGKWVISNTPPEGVSPTTHEGENQVRNTPTPRPPIEQEAIVTAVPALNVLYNKWKDALKLAESTARISLAGPVGNLQAIRQRTESLLVPDCFVTPKQTLTKGMSIIIEGFLQFVQDANLGKYIAAATFEEGRKILVEYEQEVKACIL
jgi:hypothetical protein